MSKHPFLQIVLSVLVVLGVPACYRPRPATVPLRALPLEPGTPGTRCLVVFLPGRGDRPEDYARHGFPAALRRAGSPCVMVGVDSHLGYFFPQMTLTTRLDEDVLAPARAHGIDDVWLVGISLGGLGSLLYAREHPAAVHGLILLAPYLGEKDVIQEVAAGGGLAAWTPQPPPGEADFRRLWVFLKGFAGPGSRLPPLWLAYGRDDAFALPNGMLAAVLPPGRVFTAPGGHTWRTWSRLWEMYLKRGEIPGSLGPPASLPAAPSSSQEPPPQLRRRHHARLTAAEEAVAVAGEAVVEPVAERARHEEPDRQPRPGLAEVPHDAQEGRGLEVGPAPLHEDHGVELVRRQAAPGEDRLPGRRL